MNRYDAATPVGREPREGHTPRVRSALPGSALDDVFAARYRPLIEAEVVEGVTLTLGTESGDATDDSLTSRLVAQAIADETPPEARRPRVGESRRRPGPIPSPPN